MNPTKTFNHPIKVATILKYALFSAYQRPQWAEQIPNDALIKEWWYSRLANVYVRYWSIKPRCSTDEQITLNQFGGEDYRRALQKLLEQRGIFDEADNSYLIDFVALEKAIALHSNKRSASPAGHVQGAASEKWSGLRQT